VVVGGARPVSRTGCVPSGTYRLVRARLLVPGGACRRAPWRCKLGGAYRVTRIGWRVPGGAYGLAGARWRVPAGAYIIMKHSTIDMVNYTLTLT